MVKNLKKQQYFTIMPKNTDKKKGKKTKKIILIITALIIIFLIIFFFRKINLMIKEDITLNTKENLDIINSTHGENFSFNTYLEINNYWLCNARCDENIISVDSGKVIFNNTFYVKNNFVRKNSLTLPVEKGYGQSVYQYVVYCKNMYSKSCPVNNKTYTRRKTLIVNHEPNEYEKAIIIKSLDLFHNASYNIGYSELNIDHATNIIFGLPMFFNETFKENIYSQYNILSDLRNKEYEITEKWNDDYYEESYSILKEISNKSKELLHSSNEFLLSVQNRILSYNKAMEIHEKNLKKAFFIKEMISKYPGENYEEFDGFTAINLININTEKLNNIQNNLIDFEQEKILREMFLEENKINETISYFDLSLKNTEHDYLTFFIINNLSCSIIQCNQTLLDAYISNITKIFNESKNSSYIDSYIGANDLIQDIDESKIKNMLYEIDYRCEIYKETRKNLENARNITKNNRNASNISNTEIINEENVFLYKLLSNLKINNQIIYNKKNDYLLLINIYNNSENKTPNYNLTKYFFLNFEFLESSINNIEKYCNSTNNPNNPSYLEIKNFSFKTYSMPDFNNSPNIIDMNFPEKKCCFYKKCKKCSEYDKYPLILIHGHSFNQKNSAYQSTEIFNFLEEKLTNEYISLGIENFYTTHNKIMFDILTKPTYYINKKDIFGNEIIESKDETIEEYADRLKDIIENTKKTSEMDKVNIVAHSMGGLVVRRYIQKYGHENIDNLILIATPNQGITEKIYNLCTVFGNKNECLDMKKGSDLIRKINTQYDMPKTFLIIGKGCNLDGEDSDGIVTISNAKLGEEFTYKTYYIEGECTTTKFLHNEILYNEKTVDIIKNILK